MNWRHGHNKVRKTVGPNHQSPVRIPRGVWTAMFDASLNEALARAAWLARPDGRHR